MVPEQVVKLLVGYFSNTLSETQHDQLDEWICENDENMEVFEDCLEITLLSKVAGPNKEEIDFEFDQPLNFN